MSWRLRGWDKRVWTPWSEETRPVLTRNRAVTSTETPVGLAGGETEATAEQKKFATDREKPDVSQQESRGES